MKKLEINKDIQKYSDYINEDRNDISTIEKFIKDFNKKIDGYVDNDQFFDITLSAGNIKLDINVGPEEVEQILVFLGKLIEVDDDYDEYILKKKYKI